MIRTSCPKCGREDAVAAYLAALPLLCKSCGTRLTVGEPLPDRPFAAPVPPPPPPPPPPGPQTEPLPAWTAPPEPEPEPDELPAWAKQPVQLVPVAPPTDAPMNVVMPLAPAGSMYEPDPEPAPLPSWTQPTVTLTPAEPPPEPVVPLRVATPAIAPPFPLPLASVGRRLYARFLLLIGLAVAGGVGWAVLYVCPPAIQKDVMLRVAVVAALPAVYLLANALMLARTGQDVGKRYAGVRVVSADGSQASQSAALLKRDALTLVIGLTGVGLLYWVLDFATLFGKGGRCLHDRIAKTRVVRATASRSTPRP